MHALIPLPPKPNHVLLLMFIICVCGRADHQLLSPPAHGCEADQVKMQASPAYTSVAMTTPMGRQGEGMEGVPPKYVNVDLKWQSPIEPFSVFRSIRVLWPYIVWLFCNMTLL